MTDRFEEIKARYSDLAPFQLQGLSGYVLQPDILWLIAEVERLRVKPVYDFEHKVAMRALRMKARRQLD